MNHLTNDNFWDCFDQLPSSIQKTARRNFEILKSNSKYPSLHFKKVAKYWSFRITINYRAIGIEKDNNIIWFWIGTHSNYEKLINN